MAQQNTERNLLLHPQEYDLLTTICIRTKWSEDEAVRELTHLGLEFLQEQGRQIAVQTGVAADNVIRALLLPRKRTRAPGLSEDDVATGALVFGIGLKAQELGLPLFMPENAPTQILIELPVRRGPQGH